MDRGMFPENTATGQSVTKTRSREKEEERWNAKLKCDTATGLFLGVPVCLFVCLDVLAPKWDTSSSGDFQLWCLGCSLFCSSLSLTPRTRAIWGEDCSSKLKVIYFSAHEGFMFVKGLIHPLDSWKPHSGDTWKGSSLRNRKAACWILL